MPSLHVCSLSRLHETVAAVGASHVVTLINVGTRVERPSSIADGRHLFLGMSDIVSPLDGHVVPADSHIADFLDFTRRWDRAAPMVIHCWAGISRSTAAAFIAACALRPDLDEGVLAARLRELSPSATPNGRLVALADDVLSRRGRMVEAIRSIGRGGDAFEGAPFHYAYERH